MFHCRTHTGVTRGRREREETRGRGEEKRGKERRGEERRGKERRGEERRREERRGKERRGGEEKRGDRMVTRGSGELYTNRQGPF